eukprot:IDg14559t1
MAHSNISAHTCARLSTLLSLHIHLDYDALERALLTLTAAAFANALASAAVAFILPRRHATRAAAFALLATPLTILTLFVYLDARRNAMRPTVSSMHALKSQAALCNAPAPGIAATQGLRASMNAVDTGWQCRAVALCVVVALALGTHVTASVASAIHMRQLRRQAASKVECLA